MEIAARQAAHVGVAVCNKLVTCVSLPMMTNQPTPTQGSAGAFEFEPQLSL